MSFWLRMVSASFRGVAPEAGAIDKAAGDVREMRTTIANQHGGKEDDRNDVFQQSRLRSEVSGSVEARWRGCWLKAT